MKRDIPDESSLTDECVAGCPTGGPREVFEIPAGECRLDLSGPGSPECRFLIAIPGVGWYCDDDGIGDLDGPRGDPIRSPHCRYGAGPIRLTMEASDA